MAGILALAVLVVTAASSALAQPPGGVASDAYQGISLSTPYPSVTVQATETTNLDLTVRNYGLPPQRVDLEVAGLPEAWAVSLTGGGRPVGGVFVAPNESASAQLQLDPPDDAEPGTYEFTVQASGEEDGFTLPLTVQLGEVAPPSLGLEAEFPELSGTPGSDFTYQLTLNNDSPRDALVQLSAEAPRGFQVTFSEAVGRQELTSIPVAAGASEEIEATVAPPQRVPAETFEVRVRATTEETRAELPLTLHVTGQANLNVSGPGGRVSGTATAGAESPLSLVLANEGSAPAQNVELGASEPSGWNVRFEPESVLELAPGAQQEVTAHVQPADDALAGDYMVTLRATGDGVNDSAEFRVTVRTSTVWGVVAVGIIAVALLVIVIAVMRYGRR